jgi:hypothetical protein
MSVLVCLAVIVGLCIMCFAAIAALAAYEPGWEDPEPVVPEKDKSPPEIPAINCLPR